MQSVLYQHARALRAYLVGPRASPSTQLLVSDDVNVHNNELFQLPWITETAEGVVPVRVPIHLGN